MKMVFALRFLLIVSFCVLAGLPVRAEGIPGIYPPAPQEDPKKDNEDLYIPKRIFSSSLKNIKQAEKMDVLYQSIENYIWDIGKTNQTHQSKLMELMNPKRFQYTRRITEFKPPMTAAMNDLNKYNKEFKEFISLKTAEFEKLKPEFKEEEQTAENLWNNKIEELENFAEKYFKSQSAYLNLYNKLIGYIINHAGGYYYSSVNSRVMFYKIEEYTYFGETIDALNKMAYEQRQTLREVQPLSVLP